MNRHPVLLGAVTALAVGVLAGCSHAVPATPGGPGASAAPVATPDASPSPTPTASAATASAPLRCDDLLTHAQLLAAAQGPHSPANRTVSVTSTAGGTITAETAVQGAGGLSCAWRIAGEGAATDDVVVNAAVLPGAAKDWSAQMFGDAPTAKRRVFAGISAAATCGDPGCGASAAVGSSWVRVDLLTVGLAEGTSVFAGETEDTLFTNAGPAIAAVFATVQHASAAQLRFPSHVGTRATSDCRTFVKPGPLAAAMGVRSTSYADPRYPDSVSDSIAGAAEHRIGVSSCFVNGSGTGPNSTAKITIAPDQAGAVAAMAADPKARGPLKPVTLANQVAGEHALTDCSSSSSPNECSVVFSLGTTAIQVDDGIRSKQIAEAIIAEAR
ncbi:MAG TPA: hypothetical protein VIG76_08705 [Amnibacterium sp.]|jgi:hypothetical protein|uniref:hypothetical protein n=1 Tax=Amnibacterium sp. TaxID=1872496 RepID=UPI002F936FF0